jgi:hypothetical protein
MFEKILLYSEKDWTQMVAISADQLEADLETMARTSQRIQNANENELRSL